jgi:hypothetical protein
MHQGSLIPENLTVLHRRRVRVELRRCAYRAGTRPRLVVDRYRSEFDRVVQLEDHFACKGRSVSPAVFAPQGLDD